MSSLAAILLDRGEELDGCDRQPTHASTEYLRSRGVQILTGHDEAHLEHASSLVVTRPAMTTAEVLEARRRGLPVLRRAELLGTLMDERRGMAVAGTHGKTTTTALAASMLIHSGLDPSVLVGAIPSGWNSGGRAGGGEWFLAEADEYDRSFHTLHPEVVVLTGVDMDHPDIYPDVAAVEESFRIFLAGMPPGGRLYCSASSPRGVELGRLCGTAHGSGVQVTTYGLDDGADYYPTIRSREGGLVGFDLRTPEGVVEGLESPLPFPYNLENAVGAAAASLAAGAAEAGIREGLRCFRGVARRFERKGEAGGVVVYDDYAHHPAAVEAVLRAARDLFPAERIEVAFQPHTYSRTRAMLPEFAAALRLADRAYVLDVYAAREATDPSVAGDVLARLVGESAVYVGGVAEAGERVPGMFARDPGTVLVTMGAGDVTELGPLVLRALGDAEGTEAG